MQTNDEYTIDGDTVPPQDHSHFTPNVILENPKHRRVMNYVLSVGAIATSTAIAVDASTPAFDILWLTVPVGTGILTLAGLLGLSITIPNIPKR